MKASPLVDELSLYDVVNTPGVAADLSHISSVAVCFHVEGFDGDGSLIGVLESHGLPAKRRWLKARPKRR